MPLAPTVSIIVYLWNSTVRVEMERLDATCLTDLPSASSLQDFPLPRRECAERVGASSRVCRVARHPVGAKAGRDEDVPLQRRAQGKNQLLDR